MVLSHSQYLKLQEFLKYFQNCMCPAFISNPLNMTILIISRVPIWVIFQNLVTIDGGILANSSIRDFLMILLWKVLQGIPKR